MLSILNSQRIAYIKMYDFPNSIIKTKNEFVLNNVSHRIIYCGALSF